MILYRLYTEVKNVAEVNKLVNESFDGFTVLTGAGYWKNKLEYSMIIEILAREGEETKVSVLQLALRIKSLNSQEYVYITEMPTKLTVI